ncbi:MAG: Gfo/Idh/MocA family oxidoreductase, partial [bacterium]|nr:Gfo/Idh/MocA family oxidoreductase [bacterium]
MKKIKVAIWGLGRAGWGMHTHEIDRCPGCYEIAGCYDILPERMAQMQKKYPACKAYSSPEEMLADPEIELVAVAVRSRDHVKFDIQVLEAGKYLIAEKPIAVSYAEAMKLKEVSDRHPGKMFCRQNRRFEACFQQVQEIIREGILGDIYEIKLCRHNYQRRADWQALKSCAGGQLNNWGPHLIDHALQFIHAPLESVWSDLRLVAAMGDAEDHFKAVLRGTNKIVVDIEVSGGVA